MNNIISKAIHNQSSAQSTSNASPAQSTQTGSLLDGALDKTNQQASHNSVQGASVFAPKKNAEEVVVDEGTESALKLARELSDIEIDESDFETPAFMRRKDDSHRNA